MKNAILCGFKNSGKTYWGKHLAQEMHYPFVDTDHLLENLYFRESGKKLTYPEIYVEIGEKKFRQMEHRVVLSLKGVTNSIIAIGGGTILNKDNRYILQQLGKLIYLKVDKKTLEERLFSQELPGFFSSCHSHRSFDRVYEEREVFYETLAFDKVDLSKKNDQQIIERLKEIVYGF